MLSPSIIGLSERRGLLANPSYLRLWFAGGVGNAMRWLELLVAGIFTYNATHSAFLVAVVTVARTLPMLFIGAIAGLVGEALNRKRILLTQLAVLAGSSAVLCGLALSGWLRVWHVAMAGVVTGIVWITEMAVRRRMIGEVVASDQIVPAVAFDSLTNSVARVVGPLAGGAAFERLGLGGAYFLSAMLYLAACFVVGGLRFQQQPKPLRLHRLTADLAEGLAVARSHPAIFGVVLVSIVMNVFGFSYSALIAPIGLDGFRVSPTLVGALAAAEPIGCDGDRYRAIGGLAAARWQSRAAAWFVAVPRRRRGNGAVAMVRARLRAAADGGPRHRSLLDHGDYVDSGRSPGRDALAGDGDSDDVHRHRAARRFGRRNAVRMARTRIGSADHGRLWAGRIGPRVDPPA
jgi:Transmembrane secretion effector